MRFDTSQQVRLDQQMKLAPRMIQSMELLQMPVLALQERIEQELESNVALELAEPGSAEEGDRDAESDERAGDRELRVGEQTDDGSEDFERLSAMESSYTEAFDNEYSSSRFTSSRFNGERDGKMDALANVASRGESIGDQLVHQWALTEVEPEIAAVGERLIGFIDDDGILSTDLETIHSQLPPIPGVEVTPELIERTLRELQFWLEPPGVAARSAREALMLQVDDLAFREETADHNWDDVRLLLEHHYEDLLQNRLPRIAQKTGLEMDRVQTAIELMRRLDPRPGRTLVPDDVPTVVPDVIVEYDEEHDEYIAALADSLLPPLRIARRYRKMARDRSVDASTREFAANSVRNATWLIESIQQRSNTLLRVVNAVLARQRDYFDHGPQHLKPMPMIEVADQLGVHVATVSRAVSDKWLRTPRGIVPLRMFFSGGTATESGEKMSWEAVKATLQQIVNQEDKTHPMSDEALAAALRERGIDIARRTVVKYRQQLGIPPARRRRIYQASSS